jgi:CRISPR-associated endonuclease/helicase Cas3
MISFAEFLRIVRGEEVEPYPWQARLAERCAHGEPPSAIVVPTGAGKTATVDALVWALAQQADRPAAERTVGVRIVWATDRRILVDEVHAHAEWLAELLAAAVNDQGDPLHDLASRLVDLSGGVPLVATRWRGGLEDRPERCGPLQPQIISSTVARIGSRLLFRGYGVGKRSLAIEAGLAACDTTICLDEAHLAEPFRETIEAIRLHREAGELVLALPGLRAITLTATPPRDVEDVLDLDDGDRAALGQRYTGQKHAKLVEPEVGIGEAGQVRLLAATAADHVRSGKPTVACVVNTVRRARAVFDALDKEMGEDADVALLVGPQRPADREQMLAKHRDALFNGKPGEKPLVCVATQTFEVGLDADVVAMVTESASATALVQRLGRLNRRGVTPGSATIVRDEGRWLYADDEPAAWEWLQRLAGGDGTIDVSVAALEQSTPPQPGRIPRAATLTPGIVELFAQTSPLPEAWREPDPDVFLRGTEAKPAAEVAFCWRSDLRPDVIGKDADGYRSMLLELMPPQRQELMTLSLTSARALLAARYPEGGNPAAAARLALFEADVDDAMLDAPVPEPRQDERQLPFLVLRRGTVHRGTLGRGSGSTAGGDAEDEVVPIWPSTLKPGDVIVLPTSTGGADEHGLAPLQPRNDTAIDVAADLRPNGTPAPVRLTPEALGETPGAQLASERWTKVADACALAEKAIAKARGAEARQRVVDKLVVQLCKPELLPDHTGLQLLAKQVAEHADWAVLLRSVGPVSPDGMPQLDDADIYGQDEADEFPAAEEPDATDDGSPEEGSVAAKTTADGDDIHEAADESPVSEPATHELRNLTRAWVLLPVPGDRLDRRDRLLGDDRPPPTIDAHARAVSEEVRVCAERLRLAPAPSAALMLAACAHDHGKADVRTQAFYHSGVQMLGVTPIAKSEFGTQDPHTSRIAASLGAWVSNRVDAVRRV